ncbi:hypothetical protein KBD81_01350 [Candidatus Woesebacteria bacterium]|nr:hypothetical protein [Candidatus Woesebacteria bacterium]
MVGWHVAPAPIQKPKTVFHTCEAALVKAPPDVLHSHNTPLEKKADLSRGLSVSIGREFESRRPDRIGI